MNILRKLPSDIQETIIKSLIPHYLLIWKNNIDRFYKNRLKNDYENANMKSWVCIDIAGMRNLYRLLSIRDDYYCFISSKINYHTQIREIAIFKEDEFQIKWIITGKSDIDYFQTKFVTFSDSDSDDDGDYYEMY